MGIWLETIIREGHVSRYGALLQEIFPADWVQLNIEQSTLTPQLCHSRWTKMWKGKYPAQKNESCEIDDDEIHKSGQHVHPHERVVKSMIAEEFLDIEYQAYYMSKRESKNNICECDSCNPRVTVPAQPHTISSGVIAMCGGDELRSALRRDGYFDDACGNMVDGKPQMRPARKRCTRTRTHSDWCTQSQPVCGGICTECWQYVNVKHFDLSQDQYH